jgi:hypothetical protein
MNVEYHHQKAIETSHHGSLGKVLEPVLKTYKGLSSISQESLRKNLQPIMNALKRLDAELLLDLKPVGPGQGPRVNARYVYDYR